MKSGIYKITNLVNNKFYIGSSKDINRRFSAHKRELKRNNHDNVYLQNSYNKYNLEAFKFEIIEEVEKDKLFEREQYYLDTFIFNKEEYKNISYNMSKTARGGFCGEVLKGAKHPKHKSISVFDLEMNFIEEIRGVKEVARKYNSSSSAIIGCARGKYSQSKGYVFKYSDKLNVCFKKGGIHGKPRGFETNSAVIMYKYSDSNMIIINTFSNLTEAHRQTNIDPRTIKSKCKNNESYKNEFYFKFKNKEI